MTLALGGASASRLRLMLDVLNRRETRQRGLRWRERLMRRLIVRELDERADTARRRRCTQ